MDDLATIEGGKLPNRRIEIGSELARMEPEERWACIKPNLHRPRWREPILLCARQLGIIERRSTLADDLVGRILNAQSEYESLLHRDIFLAAEMASDDVGLSTAVLDEITGRLMSLWEDPVPPIRQRALAALAHLARIGHELATRALEKEMGGAEPFRFVEVVHAVESTIQSGATTLLRRIILPHLQHADTSIRVQVIAALAPLAPSDVEIRSAILSHLNDENLEVRQTALERRSV